MHADLIQLLKNWRLNENEAIIYVTIIMMGAGCARDLHEITHIPRGKIYQSLSRLMEEGLISSLEGTPVRYWARDIRSTFEKIKRETLVSLDEIIDKLEEIDEDVASRNSPLHMLKSNWAIEKQTNSLFKRVKNEIVIICNSPDWFLHYKSTIRNLEKRVNLYFVINNPENYPPVIRYYTGDALIRHSLLHSQKEIYSLNELECEIFADSHEHMILFKKEDSYYGYFSTRFFLTEYMIRTIIDRIQPVITNKECGTHT